MITFATMKEQDSNSPIIHLQQQQLLLRMEYEYEKEEFKRQTENMGLPGKWNGDFAGILPLRDEVTIIHWIN